jgi:hypothetical protein
MAHCINHNHVEVKELSEKLGLHKAVLASKIAVWQEQTGNMDRFPTSDELTPITSDSDNLSNENESDGDLFYALKDKPKIPVTDGKSLIYNINQFFAKSSAQRTVISEHEGSYYVKRGYAPNRTSDVSEQAENWRKLQKFNREFESIFEEPAFYHRITSKSKAIEIIPNQKAVEEILFRDDVVSGNEPMQLETERPVEQVNQVLDTKLKGLLASLGITVEAFENFKNSQGVDAIAVADIVKGIIYMDESKSNLLTLPEETAHFIIELLGETPLVKRLLALMESNDYYKEVLGDEYDAYFNAYKGRKNDLIREAAGKLLSRAIVARFNQNELNLPQDKMNLLQRLFEYVKRLFGRISKQDFNKMVAEAYGTTAEQFLNQSLQGMDKSNLVNKLQLFALSDTTLESFGTKLEKAKESIAKRISVYKNKDKKKLAQKEELVLAKLIEDLNNKNYLEGALGVVSSAQKTFKGVVARIAELKNNIGNINAMSTSELMTLASVLRDMKGFTNSYLPMMKEMKLEMTKMLIEDESNADVKAINDMLTEVVDKAELLDSEYYNMAKPIYARFIKPFVGKGPIENLNLLLDEGGEDITFMQRWVDAMANSGEPMLQILDVVVKDAKQEARDESYRIMKEVISARMMLDKAGVKDTKWMYEVKADGSLSGNNVYEYNYADWKDNRDREVKLSLQAIRKANKALSLPEDDQELMHEIFSNDVLEEQYRRMMGYWYRNNTEALPNAEDILNHMRNTMSAEDFEQYELENTRTNAITGEVYYIRELSRPSQKYLNPQYSAIMAHPEKKAFYEFTMSLKEQMDSQLPENRRLGRLAPQIRTDFVEKARQSGNLKTIAKNAKEAIREQFQIMEDEDQLGDRFKITDENNKPVNFLPVYFTGRLKDMSNLSTDFAESITAYSIMANDYGKMNKVVDMLELGRDIISNRPLKEKDSSGNFLKESLDILGKKVVRSIKKDAGSSNIKARLDDYFVMNVYGKTRVQGKDMNFLGVKINSEKALDVLGRYTSMNNLALNIYAGIQNPLVGNSAIRLEAIAGQFFNNADLLAADAKYFSNLAQNMANVGSRNPKDFISLWSEKMEVMQDFEQKAKEMNLDRRSLISKMFNQSALYFLSHAGEHQMQHRTSFALANQTKLKTSDGKDITLLEAFDTKGNRLELKPGLKNLDGSDFNEASLRAWKRKQNAINNSLHGIYNEYDLLAIQQYGLLRQALMFRKFMRPGYNRRFRKAYYNYEGQFDVEGYYRTFGRFGKILARDLKRGQFLLASRWNDLTALEKKNIMRTITDVSYITAVSMFLAYVLPMIGGDDEDNWLANMASYQAHRLRTELKFYIDPRETLKILQSPAAGISQINRVLDLLAIASNPFTASEVIERGKWKGYTRLHKASVGTIPFYKTITDWRTPSDKLIYLKLGN